MITEDTVLIIGAGASFDYNFPIGITLLEDIYSFLQNTDYVQIVDEIMSELEPQQKNNINNIVNQFCEKLDCASSIDDLLKQIPQKESYLITLGKLCILLVLSMYENEKYLKPIETDERKSNVEGTIYKFHKGWYNNLWNLLYSGTDRLEQLSENKITFITFNYDRSLEKYLYMKAKGYYHKDDLEVKKELQKLKIFHVYGKLGSLIWKDTPLSENEYSEILYRDNYGHLKYHHDFKTIKTLCEKIFTYHETEKIKLKKLNEFKNKIKQADNVFFLGFGFHEQNLKILQDRDNGDYGYKNLKCTNYKLGKVRTSIAYKKIGEILGMHPYDSVILGKSKEQIIQEVFFDCEIKEFFEEHANKLD